MSVPGSASNPLYVQFGGQSFSTTLSASTDNAVSVRVTGDTVDRLSILASGKMTWGTGSGAGDTNLYRSAADTLKTDDTFVAVGKVLTTAGLGVGNSAAAATPGTVVKKIEVFDASGASLGYLPVYDAISA